MKKTLLSILVCLLVAATGAIIIALAPDKPEAPAAQDNSASRALARVVVEPVRAVRLLDDFALTGTVEPWKDITISAEVGGAIEVQAAEESDRVEQGALLFEIDSASLQAQLELARSELRLAEQELKRIQDLSRGGITSEQDRDRATAAKVAATADLQVLSIRQQKSSVRAPFDGIIDTIHREKGEYVAEGSPLVRIVQLQQVKVLVGVPERWVPFVELGEPVAMTFDAMPGEGFEGHVYRIAPTATTATRTFTTQITLDNPNGRIRPGMIVRVRIVRRAYDNAVTAPIFSVIPMGDAHHVFVEVDGTARKRVVETGVYKADRVQVTRGLEPGDRLIIKGQRDLQDGDRVHVLDSAA